MRSVIETLFYLAHTGLPGVPQQLLGWLLPSFWPGGEFVEMGRLSLHEVTRLEIACSRWRAGIAVQMIVDTGILQRVDERTARGASFPPRVILRPVADWTWDPAVRARADDAWATLRVKPAVAPEPGPWGSANRRAFAAVLGPLVQACERLGGKALCISPLEPRFMLWVAAAARMAKRYSAPKVMGAIRVAMQEPEIIAPFSPTSFVGAMPALILRARRHDLIQEAP